MEVNRKNLRFQFTSETNIDCNVMKGGDTYLILNSRVKLSNYDSVTYEGRTYRYSHKLENGDFVFNLVNERYLD